MRAMRVERFGPGARPRLMEAPVPEPRAAEAVVRMAFASVNPADWKCAEGWLTRFASFNPALPFGLGFDGAGTVAAIHAGETRLKVGDRVFVRGNQMNGDHGTFADYCRTTTDGLAPVPDAVRLVDAATVPTAGLTAWQALIRGGLARGQSVLVNGGAGGSGGFAVQFAKAAGARVAATASAGNLAYLQALGVDLALDYRDETWPAQLLGWAPGGVDLLLDTVNLHGGNRLLSLMRRGGVLTAIATLDEQSLRHDAAAAAARDVQLVEATAERTRSVEDLTAIGALMAKGEVRPPQVTLMPLEAAAAALDAVKGGHVRGKIVLEIGGEA